MNNAIGFTKEKLWTREALSLTDISYQVMANSTFKEEIDFKELKKETRGFFSLRL